MVSCFLVNSTLSLSCTHARVRTLTHTLTFLLVTVGPSEARETAAVVVCQKVLEMREEHTVHVASIKKDLKEEGWVLNNKSV